VITIVTAIKEKILKVEKRDVIAVFQEEPHRNWFASGIRLKPSTIGVSCLLTGNCFQC